jgi:hypothetical protein
MLLLLTAACGCVVTGSKSTGTHSITAAAADVRSAAALLCPVVDGVCDAATCAGGFNANDTTQALQAALHSGASTVLVSNMGAPWLVTQVLYLPRGNMTVQLAAGAIIEAKRYAPFWNNTKQPVTKQKPLISTAHAGSHNITIRGPPPSVLAAADTKPAMLRMHKRDAMNTSLYPIHDEWRHAIWVAGSSDITIADLHVVGAMGDGMCLSWETQRVHIKRVVCNDNYRNALTITNARDVLVEDSIFANTSGTAPAAGCDIEPDWAYTWLKNISFLRCSFLGNEGNGFSLAPGALKPFNRSQFAGKGCDTMRTSDQSPACPLSISIRQCIIEGRPATAQHPCARAATHDKRYDCWPLSSHPHAISEDEQFGVAIGGIRSDGPRGTFVVADTVIRHTALSGILISEKSSEAAVVVFSNVTLDRTATNLTDYSVRMMSHSSVPLRAW